MQLIRHILVLHEAQSAFEPFLLKWSARYRNTNTRNICIIHCIKLCCLVHLKNFFLFCVRNKFLCFSCFFLVALYFRLLSNLILLEQRSGAGNWQLASHFIEPLLNCKSFFFRSLSSFENCIFWQTFCYVVIMYVYICILTRNILEHSALFTIN